MLRLLLLLLCLGSGVSPALAQWAGAAGGSDCCCGEDGHQADDQPRFERTPCGCGCIAPLPERDGRQPEAPRERPDQLPVLIALPAAPPRPEPAAVAPAALVRPSAVPRRAPPPRAALGVWQE